MSFQFIVVFTLLCHNVFTTAQSQSSSQNSTIENNEKCGQLFVKMESTLSGGRPALVEEMPWQASIYTKLTVPYMQVCGGSLVSTKVVISAAHCFWSETNQQLPAKDFAVAFGKLYRPWNDPMDTRAQKFDIREIRIPPRFHGSITNFQDDLALLVLTAAIDINNSVQPVCLDFGHALNKKHTADGNFGKVAGWGRSDESGKPSPTLQVVDLPIVDVSRCFDTIEPAFRPAITSDKICAGRTMEGTAVCMGDSGGGLAFPETSSDGERYFLRGVVSTAPMSVNENFCNIYTYATFTHIAKHEHFIRDVIKRASEANDEIIQETPLKVNDPNAPPIPDITSLPLFSKLVGFRSTDVIIGGRPKPLKGAKKFKKKDKNDKSEIDTSNQATQTPDDNVTEARPTPQDPDAEAMYTVQIVEEPVATQTKPARPLADTDADDDDDILDKTPNVIPTTPKPQADPDAEAKYTVQIVEEPVVTQTKPLVDTVDVDTDVDEDDILNKTPNVIPTTTKPQADPDAEAEYTVQIIEEPTVTPISSTDIDETTEKKPVLLSISSEPFLSTDSQTTKTNMSIENEQILSTDKQLDKSIEDELIQSLGNQPDIFTGNQPTQSTGNQPSQSFGNQPSQSTSNQAAQSWNQLPLSSYPAPAKANHLPSSENQPAQTITTQPETTEDSPIQFTSQVAEIGNKPIQPAGNELPLFSWNQPGQSTGNQPTQTVNKPTVPVGNRPPFSTGNQPVEPISNQPAESGNPSVLSIGNHPVKSIEEQSGVAPGISGTQPVYFEQSMPASYTTQNNPEVTVVHHKWNTQSDYHHHQPYNFHHDYHYNHHKNHNGHYHHDYHHGYHHDHHHSPHYHQHHDWHNFHRQW